MTVQAATTVGVMKTQTLCFRPIAIIELRHIQSEALGGNMFVIPVPFTKYHKHMLAHIKEMLEDRNGYMSINPRFNKLTTTLRTAVEKGDGTLDKEATSHDDLFDPFRLSLMFWH